MSGPGLVLAALTQLLVACLLLPGAAAGAVQPASPSLALSPGGGPPGAQVTATAGGFEECVQEAAEDDFYSYELEPDPGSVQLSWAGAPLVTVSVPEAAAGVSIQVPEGASFGPGTVSATCVENPKLEASGQFDVTRRPPKPVMVPDLTKMTIRKATRVLGEAGLELGSSSGSGDRIIHQAPDPGTEAEPGSPVDVVLEAERVLVKVPPLVDRAVDEARAALQSVGLRLGARTGEGSVVSSQGHPAGALVPVRTRVGISVSPRPVPMVVVPDLTGRSLTKVSGRLLERGLRLGEVSGKGDLVRAQSPRSGALVSIGTLVRVTVKVRPARLVSVPDVVGGTVEEAEAALSAVRLAFANPDADLRDRPQATVEGQEPSAGTRVLVGTAVTVTLTARPVIAADTKPVATRWLSERWPALALVVAVLAIGVLTALRVAGNRMGEQWVHTHVRAVAGAAPPLSSTAPEVTPKSAGPTHVFRLEPHIDTGTAVLEEVQP